MTKNLPAKSRSRGIQPAHTRNVMTKAGRREVVVNRDVKKKVVSKTSKQLSPKARVPLPAVRNNNSLAPVGASIDLPVKERNITFRPTKEWFNKEILNYPEIRLFFAANNKEKVIQDVFWEQFKDNGGLESLDAAHNAINDLIDDIEGGVIDDLWGYSDVAALTPYGDFESVGLEDIVNNHSISKDTFSDTEGSFAFSWSTDDLNGEVLQSDDDGMFRSLDDRFEMVTIGDKILTNIDMVEPSDSDTFRDDPSLDYIRKSIDGLNKAGVPFFLLTPGKWYEQNTPLIVPKASLKRFRKVMNNLWSTK